MITRVSEPEHPMEEKPEEPVPLFGDAVFVGKHRRRGQRVKVVRNVDGRVQCRFEDGFMITTDAESVEFPTPVEPEPTPEPPTEKVLDVTEEKIVVKDEDEKIDPPEDVPEVKEPEVKEEKKKTTKKKAVKKKTTKKTT